MGRQTFGESLVRHTYQREDVGRCRTPFMITAPRMLSVNTRLSFAPAAGRTGDHADAFLGWRKGWSELPRAEFSTAFSG